MPRLILFDFDGTLADTFAWFRAQLPDLIARHRLSAAALADLEALRGAHGREVMRRLGVRWWQMPSIASDLRARMARDVAGIRLFPGVGEALENLAVRGVMLAVVSSNAEANVRAVLGERAGLIGAFACGVSVFGKARRFREVMRRCGATAAETLAIGDELRDLDAARAVGIRFGAVAWGYTSAEAFTGKADLVFQSAQEWTRAID